MDNRQVNVDLTAWGIEEREEDRVHLELLWDATMDGVVTINTDLVSRIIGEVESDSRMGWGASNADKDFANDLIGIDADRVRTERAWLLPRSIWRSDESSRRTFARTGIGAGTGW
jgi:hypothetical protein